MATQYFRLSVFNWRFVMALLICLAGVVEAKYSGGDGSSANPYQLATYEDLMTLAEDANDYGLNFVMTADIDLDPNLPARQVFTTAVIALDTDNSGGDFDGLSFTGVFDGAGHKILNLTIDVDFAPNDFLGLFGAIGSGTIKNLGLENVNIIHIYNSYYIGGLTGVSYGNISNCYTTSFISGYDYLFFLGGMAGENLGIISNCLSTVAINGVDVMFSDAIGGLIGHNGGNVIDCCSVGTIAGNIHTYSIGGLAGSNGWPGAVIRGCNSEVNITGQGERIGGLVGDNQEIISNCKSSSNVDCPEYSQYVGGLVGNNEVGSINNCSTKDAIISGENYVGGLVGYNIGMIRNCYSMNAVTGSNYLGGLVGRNESGNIINCHSSGNVTGEGWSECIGGLVGTNFEGGISNCYSINTVNIAGGYIGGLVGYNWLGEINNCYSAGAVNDIDSSEFIGGLVGLNEDGSIYSSYFLNTNGPDNGWGEPLTDEQMKQQNSFIGWDFVWETENGTEDIWSICEAVSYPKLAWQFDFMTGDSDDDWDVDFIDFAAMGLKWMQVDFDIYCGGIDLTGDGWVDLYDLAVMCGFWLQ